MLGNIFNSAKAWRTSAFSELPQVQPEAPDLIQHFCIIAGGLALILSRHTAIEVRCNFRSTLELYQELRYQLRKVGRSSASAELLNDVMHEVAQVADAHTRASLKICLHARTEYEQDKKSKPAAVRPARDTAMTMTPPTTRAASLGFAGQTRATSGSGSGSGIETRFHQVRAQAPITSHGTTARTV